MMLPPPSLVSSCASVRQGPLWRKVEVLWVWGKSLDQEAVQIIPKGSQLFPPFLHPHLCRPRGRGHPLEQTPSAPPSGHGVKSWFFSWHRCTPNSLCVHHPTPSNLSPVPHHLPPQLSPALHYVPCLVPSHLPKLLYHRPGSPPFGKFSPLTPPPPPRLFMT